MRVVVKATTLDFIHEQTTVNNSGLGKDARGNDWYAKTESDGSQIWVRTRNGKIDNAGVNTTPRTWDDETGLYNNTRR